MSRVERSRREKVTRYSVRKVSFGAASVAVAAFFMFLGNGAVYAAEPNVTATDAALAATPANNQLDENSGSSEATAPKAQADTTTPTPADASSTSVESATVSKAQADTTTSKPADATPAPVVSSTTSTTEEKLAEKNTEASSAEANSVENKEQTTVKAEEPSTTSVATTKSAEETATTESHKPKSRKKRAVDASSTAPNTTSDEAANQVYTAPEDSANVDDLATKLKDLPKTVENEKKLATIDEIGKTKGISPGKITEIDEFGGWTAIRDSEGHGKFAVVRKTAAGVFPLETVNTVKRGTSNYDTWTEETSFDQSSDYALLLSKVRTEKNKNESTFDGEPYKPAYEGNTIARGLKGFNGIEKTFKVYSPSIGSSAKISFKIGYTGDIGGTKAKYKVELIGNKDGAKVPLYSVEFAPQVDRKDGYMTVEAAKNGSSKVIKSSISDNSYVSITDKLAEKANMPNGQAGTFTSKEIDIPEGYTSYKVRISSADNTHLGMGYQVTWDHYALPITGLGFTVTQDTRKVAKDLLKKVYTKLTEQKAEDTKWSTPETKANYEAKLQAIQEALTSDASTTDSYKTVAIGAVAQQKKLNEEVQIKNKSKAAVAAALAAKEKAIEGNSKLSEAEKTAAKAEAKKAADDATKAIEAAKDQAGVDAKETAGTEAVAAVNPVGKDNAKAAVAAALAAKEKAIEGNSKLSEAEKAAAKAQVVNKAKEAIEAIQKAATEADVDQAIRNFVYRISAVIREQEEYDLSKLFVNGSVTVKQGESLTDKDVLSKLNLPSGVEIVKVEKPTTSALGTVMAKVTVKLADGSVEEINVPVEVIVSQNHGNEGNGANNGATNTDAKADKAKLEGAIHQLDELIIKESAKLDAETAKEANDLLADAKKVFANADASQAEVDAMVKRIEDFMAKVAPSTDHTSPAKDQAAQTSAVAPATAQAANANQAAANARTVAKELPNTGTADSTVAMVAAAASALLGLGLAGRRRKEDEEA